jgi:hypothetical protein
MESHSDMKPLTHYEEIFDIYLQVFNMSSSLAYPADVPVIIQFFPC